MEENNEFYAFLLQNEVAQNDLPLLVLATKVVASSIMGGCKKVQHQTKIYFCVCNSGHSVNCNELELFHSGWNIRVSGKQVFLMSENEKHKFDLAQLPRFKNVYFVTSKRAKVTELARDRTDMLYVSSNRKRLRNKVEPQESNIRRVKK